MLKIGERKWTFYKLIDMLIVIYNFLMFIKKKLEIKLIWLNNL